MDTTIKIITDGLRDFASGDIKKSLEKDMLIATCMLCVCFIDSVSGYYCGIDYPNGNRKDSKGKQLYKVGKRYKKFCEDYLQKHVDRRYTPQLVYDDLRNSLVHSYSGINGLDLSKGAPKKYHLNEYKPGRALFLADIFYLDVNKAFEYWLQDLSIHSHLQLKALEWHKDHKIFELGNVDLDES